MKKIDLTATTVNRLGLFALSTLLGTSLSATVLITEVSDGTLGFDNPSGDPAATATQQPKFIEITNVGDTVFTFGPGAGIILQQNDTTDFEVDHDLEGFSINPGDVFVLVSITPSDGETVDNTTGKYVGQLAFEAMFGEGIADYYNIEDALGNGDDRVMIYDGTSVVDTFGAVGVDGTGEPWEYTDGYAYRKAGITSAKGLAFDPEEWVFGGVDSLEAETAQDIIALAQAVLTPGVYGEFGGTPATWGGFPIVDIDGSDWVDTGSWLGWVALIGSDWIWSHSLGIFLYVPEPGSDTTGGAWAYALRSSS